MLTSEDYKFKQKQNQNKNKMRAPLSSADDPADPGGGGFLSSATSLALHPLTASTTNATAQGATSTKLLRLLTLPQALPVTWMQQQSEHAEQLHGSGAEARFFSDLDAAAAQTSFQQLPEASTWSQLLAALFTNNNNSTSDQLDDTGINWFNSILALVLVLLMLTTAVGNLFVIVAILIERNLRTIGNYLVLSLAIADLLVACLVMPLAGIYQILERWTLGVLLCDIWTSADVFCCTGEYFKLLPLLPLCVNQLTLTWYAMQKPPYCTCWPSRSTGTGP